MDREKVIKGLEDTEIMLKLAVDRGGEMAVMGAFKCYNHVSDALALLKEQEAVKPGIAQDIDGIFATCGNCKKKLWKIMGLEFVVNPKEMPRFCPHCGQAVKWE